MLQDDYVRVRKQDLDKLTTEVMQLREFLPRVLNRDLIEALRKVRAAQTSISIITLLFLFMLLPWYLCNLLPINILSTEVSNNMWGNELFGRALFARGIF